MAENLVTDEAYDAAERAQIQTGGNIEAILAAAAPLIAVEILVELLTEMRARPVAYQITADDIEARVELLRKSAL